MNYLFIIADMMNNINRKRLKSYNIVKQKKINKYVNSCYTEWKVTFLATWIDFFNDISDRKITMLINSWYEPYLVSYLDVLKHISPMNRIKLTEYCKKTPIIDVFNQIDNQVHS